MLVHQRVIILYVILWAGVSVHQTQTICHSTSDRPGRHPSAAWQFPTKGLMKSMSGPGPGYKA